MARGSNQTEAAQVRDGYNGLIMPKPKRAVTSPLLLKMATYPFLLPLPKNRLANERKVIPLLKSRASTNTVGLASFVQRHSSPTQRVQTQNMQMQNQRVHTSCGSVHGDERGHRRDPNRSTQVLTQG